jgi:hypothetical protein
MTEPTKLPRHADELLRDFPLAEPDFEAQAKAIEARLGVPPADTTTDWLLAPVLEPEPGEPEAPSSARSAAPKVSLAELARRSVQKKDDSTELARELMAVAAQHRRPTAEMVERVRAAGRSVATATPLPASATPVPTNAAEEAARPSGVIARPSAPSPGDRRGEVIAVLGGALALAASVGLFLRGQGSEPTPSPSAQTEQAPANAAKTPSAPLAPEPARPSAVGKAAADDVVSPEALAAAPEPLRVTQTTGKSGAAAAPTPAPASKGAPSPGADPKAVAVALDEDPKRTQPTPAAKVEPPTEPQLKPAEGLAGNIPLSPSAGAISTALNGVRANAQACLAGQTEPVRAVVTFAADGHVLSVSAPGAAGPCLQAALSKARIAPFAKESFSAPTTIRPP